MGEGARADARYLQVQQGFPSRRTVWPDQSERRCAASIGANIAEGCCRKGDCEFGRFLQIAMGSASELEYHLLLARDLEMLESSDYERLAGEVTETKRMLVTLIQKLKAES